APFGSPLTTIREASVNSAPQLELEAWSSRPRISLTASADYIETTSDPTQTKRISLYTPELQLLAETDGFIEDPVIAHEYVWFAGQPVAQITTATDNIAWYFNDHLGTPILQTDAAANVVWSVEREPYGSQFAVREGGTRHQPLAFPGQEEQGLETSYNMFRWYRAGWGRYTQADPLGAGGQGHFTDGGHMHLTANLWTFYDPADGGDFDLYSYAGGNPGLRIDPLGLQDNSVNASIRNAAARGDVKELSEILNVADDVVSPQMRQFAREALKRLNTSCEKLLQQESKNLARVRKAPLPRGSTSMDEMLRRPLHKILEAASKSGPDQKAAQIIKKALGRPNIGAGG
ncbi:MAG TPA: RHS domain-containing protein, partial [Thermoanaerobaculia bacterium]|nr:RHS domain-containing protein [Thermoanaerobaculia bacterium]